MRDFLFRGKNIDSGEWFYWRLSDVFKRFSILSKLFDMRIDFETVSVYTGCEDNNDKCIFEGDIIEEGCNGLVGVVVYDDSLGTYRLEGLGEDYTIKNAHIEWEVIGNKYDNPELLNN